MVLGLAQALHTLAVGSSGCIDMLADCGGTDKGDALDILMGQEDFRFIPGAGHDIEDAVRNAGFLVEFCKAQAGHGGGGSGLEHECIAAHNAKRCHPAHRNHGREVPRCDAGKHADRLTVERGVIAGGGVHEAFAHEQGGSRAGQLGHFQRLADVAGSLAPALAVFLGHEHGQLIHVFLDQVAQLHHDACALADRGVSPCRIGSLGAGDGLFDFFLGAAGDLSDSFARGRIVNGVELFTLALYKLSADKGFHDFHGSITSVYLVASGGLGQMGVITLPYCAFSEAMNASRASSVGISLEQAWLATSMAADALPLSSASSSGLPAIRACRKEDA